MMTAVSLVMILPVPETTAQVSGDLLPDPIGSEWLTGTLRRQVAPSVVEWIEIENAHEAYLENFRVLQKGELARYRAFLEESMAGVPDGQTIRKFVRKLEGIRRLIESSDSVLFSEIEEILAESKRDSFARLRNLRALKRLTVAYGSSRSDRAVPLWDLLERWEADLPPEQRELVASTLASYENDLVSALQVWRKAQDQMLVVMADELNREGIDRIDSSDPDSETMRAFRDALRAASLKTSNAAAGVTKLNERLLRSLEDITKPIDHRRIRTAYIQLLSKGRVPADPSRFVSALERMLAAEDLDTTIREELLVLFTEYATVDDRHVRKMLSLIQSEGAVDKERLRAFDDLRLDLARQFRTRLDRIADLSGRTDLRIISKSGGLRDRDDSAVEATEDISIIDQISAGRGGAGHFICQPILRRDFESMVDRLDPEPWQQAIIGTIYDDYLQAWRAQVTPISSACNTAQSNVRRYDPSDPQLVAMDMDQLRESYRLAALAVAELESLDEHFFESLLSTCEDEQRSFIERLACARSIELLLRGTDALFRPREVAFARANVMSALERVDLSIEESAAVSAVLALHGSSMIEVGRAARDIRMELEFESHRLNDVMSRRIAEENATSADYGLAFRELSARMATKHGAAMEEWFDTESAFIEVIRTALSDENRVFFDEFWKRDSNPMVYRSSGDVATILKAALEMDDLGDDQMVALLQVFDDHQMEWTTISDEMASINQLLRGFGALSDESTFESWRTLEQSFSRLEFERREVDMRALRRLSLYLNTDQRKRFPVLQNFDDTSGD